MAYKVLYDISTQWPSLNHLTILCVCRGARGGGEVGTGVAKWALA